MPRHFRTCPGRTLALPQNLIAGPGRTNMRMKPGDVITLDDASCVREQRFVNGRLRAGDWEELDEAPADAPAPDTVPDPNAAPSGPLGLAMHDMAEADVKKALASMTSKKEG